MRNLRLVVAVLAAFCVVAGCHHWRKKPPFPPRPPYKGIWCKSRVCNVSVYLSEDCELTDASGTPLGIIDLKVGTHLCFFNRSACPVVLEFPTDLFGESRAETSLNGGECINLTVNGEARGQEYLFDIVCECEEGNGHTNPQVRVGDDDEGEEEEEEP
jgi:hypothetical protein